MKYLKLSITVILFGIILILGCDTSESTDSPIITEETPLMLDGLNDDHDYKHITFINQTSRKIKFGVNLSLRPDKTKTLESHSANYVSITDCYSDGEKKNFEIYFEYEDGANDGDRIQKNGEDFIVHRKCGENLYLWHQDGEYKVNDEPHINADLSGCNDDTTKPAILFVHGYNDKQNAWGHFARIAEENDWRVFRTSVSADGSIKKRARMLNAYIKKAAEQCKIPDSSLRVVGHSMGGLDLRYLVSYNYSSAKKFERMYTIATPHQGSGYAYPASSGSDAARDLQPSHMEDFNLANPYYRFEVKYDDGTTRKIPFLALRFACAKEPNEGDSDFIVEVSSQRYPAAPYSTKIYHGKHMPSGICTHGYEAEQQQDWLIKAILKDNKIIDGELYSIPISQ